MLQFMKPAFEQLIKFQALISELKAYCGGSIHAKGQRLLGLDFIPDIHLGVSGSKPENAENGRLLHRWSPSGETMQASL